MTPYELLFARHLKTVYKKGAYKGDAPMDKRGKSHFRIVKGENMVVHLHNTDILTAFRNGEFEIDLNGWAHSCTTRASINYALGVCRQHVSISNRNIMGISQSTVDANGARYVYYDGIRFNQAGELVSKPKPFEARRIDKAKSKEFTKSLKASGFKAVFPLLYATAQAEDYRNTNIDSRWTNCLQDADYAHSWPEIVVWFKYAAGWSSGTYGTYEISDAKGCWGRMMEHAKGNMYNIIRTEVTKL